MAFLYADPKTIIEVGTSKTMSTEIATIDKAFDFQRIFGYLPNPDPILKAEGKDIDLYTKLLFDAHVGAVVDSLRDGLKALEWTVDRGKAKSRHAKLVQGWLSDFDIQTFCESIVHARLMGYQPLEVMWRDMGGLLVPYEIVAKPHRWFVFGQKGDLRFRTIDNQSEGVSLEQYPRKFLVPRYDATYDNPYGTGVLARCFWPVTFKKGGLKFWATYLEKFGVPHVVIRVPASTPDDVRQALLRQGSSMVQDAVAVINDTDRIEILESKNQAANVELYDRWLAFHNEEISKAIKSETLTTQIGQNGGAFAASKTHADIAATGIDSVKNLAVRYINIVVQWMMDLNVSETVAPPLVAPYEEEDVDQELAERDRALTDPMKAAGLRLSKSYFMRAYGFEDDDIEQVVVPQPPTTPNPAPGAPPLDANAPLQFAAGDSSAPTDTLTVPGQEEIDALIASLDAGDLQTSIEPVMQPVIDFIRSASSYAEIEEKLFSLYSEMPVKDFEEQLAKLIFIAEVWGRANAGNEDSGQK